MWTSGRGVCDCEGMALPFLGPVLGYSQKSRSPTILLPYVIVMSLSKASQPTPLPNLHGYSLWNVLILRVT